MKEKQLLFLAIFRKSLLKNSILYSYILNAIFYNCEALTGFFVDYVNTGTLEVFVLLKISVVECRWPHFAKLCGIRQIQDIR